MKNIKELLPIGSVVLLKNGQKRLMINGVMQTDGNGKEHDYIGVLYPEGNVGLEMQYLFAHEDIDKIFFRGYQDEERDEFIDKLMQFYSSNR